MGAARWGCGIYINESDRDRIYSQTFGEAPHGRTKDILLSWTKYQHFNIILPKKNLNAYEE